MNFFKKLRFSLLLALAYSPIVSCSEKHTPKDKEAFYISAGSAPKDTKFFVNGNPTNRNNAISLFLIEGQNEIEFRSEFHDEGYHMRIVKTKDLFSSDFETLIDVEKNSEEAKKSSTATVKIDRWWRWTWQDCDALDDVTDKDKDAILKLFNTICDLANNFEDNNKFLTTHPDILRWSEHPYFTERNKELIDKVIESLPARSELIETKEAHEDIEMLIGKQIIMLRPTKNARLYDLSAKVENETPDEDGTTWNYSLGFNEMFFVKKNNQWKIILPVN